MPICGMERAVVVVVYACAGVSYVYCMRAVSGLYSYMWREESAEESGAGAGTALVSERDQE